MTKNYIFDRSRRHFRLNLISTSVLEGDLAKENKTNWFTKTRLLWHLITTALFLVINCISVSISYGQTISPATGGSSISANTYGTGAYTALTGPTYTENACGTSRYWNNNTPCS